MRIFDYEKLSEFRWDNDVLRNVARIHEFKGRQTAFAEHNPKEALRLAEIAKIQSTESSNRLEGIVTTSTRLRQLVQHKTAPRSRSEREIVGYRDVLNTIHESHEYIPIRTSYILQLHRDLMKPAGISYGGHFKNVQNHISETREDGTVVTRFTPVAPYETQSAIEAICASYGRTLAMEAVDPLVLIPVFFCDFLCIHPFNDGNGRMSRLLTLLMLYQNGYDVGKYISIEAQIAKTKDEYYEALRAASDGWHEGRNDVMPFIRYTLQIILACYVEFESRVGIVGRAEHSAYDAVLAYVQSHIGRFRGTDVIEACPSVGRSAALASLKKLSEEGIVQKKGSRALHILCPQRRFGGITVIAYPSFLLLKTDSNVTLLEHMGHDGKQTYRTKFYNLDAILSVVYRVNSRNSTMFRKWASTILKDYLLRGYAVILKLFPYN